MLAIFSQERDRGEVEGGSTIDEEAAPNQNHQKEHINMLATMDREGGGLGCPRVGASRHTHAHTHALTCFGECLLRE